MPGGIAIMLPCIICSGDKPIGICTPRCSVTGSATPHVTRSRARPRWSRLSRGRGSPYWRDSKPVESTHLKAASRTLRQPEQETKHTRSWAGGSSHVKLQRSLVLTEGARGYANAGARWYRRRVLDGMSSR
eukprot:3832181-Rhodomonas_salina.1